MDVGRYITSIDWPMAVALGAVLIAIGLVLLRFLLASTSEVARMLPGVGGAAGNARRDARAGLPPDSWVCTTCRSVNTPHSSHCYRGCGEREVLAEPLPTDRSLVAEGHNGRHVR